MVFDQGKFLDKIGTAHMESEWRKVVFSLAKEQHHLMEEQGGVETSMTDTEIKQYMDKVLNEIKNTSDHKRT
jgi:hypothetical protein